MKKILTILIFSSFGFSGFASTIQNIKYSQENEVSKLEITLDSMEKVNAKRFHVTEDKQIIIDLENATGTQKVLREFDTSEFTGSVVFVSPYKRADNPLNTRIALQLRDNVRSILQKSDNKFILLIENRFGVFNQKEIDESKASEAAEKVSKNRAKGLNEEEDQSTTRIYVPKSEKMEDILENLTMSGKKKYIGKKITLNVKEMPVDEIIKMLAEVSGFNIILDDDISKVRPLTLSLLNVPWDQILDTVLDLSKLIATKKDNILLITTLEKATEEKKKKYEASIVIKQEEPLVTKVFPISFAKLAEINTIIAPYITKDRGSVSLDNRSNKLIIKDTIDVMEKVKKIIEVLDVQNPQILIEAKIVEANEKYSKELGLKNGFKIGYDPITPTKDVINSGPGFSFSSAPDTGDNASSLLGFSVKVFQRVKNLQFDLQLMESESKGKIVSNPKIITEHRKPATISSTEQTSFKLIKTTTAGTEETFETIAAALNLVVTPQVTNEGSIAMDIALTKESFGARPSTGGPPDKNSRALNTSILVDNGATIIIGGMYSYSKIESESGVPYLKDLPLVGWLFKTAYNPSYQKNELIIFLTPRIINQEEAGLIQATEQQNSSIN